MRRSNNLDFPSQVDIEIPMLTEIERLGGQARPKDLYERLAAHFQLTEVQKRAPISPKDSRNKWENTIQWVRNKLVNEKGELESHTRGLWKITAAGRKRLNTHGLLMHKLNDADDDKPKTKRNPTWSKDELILALNLYLAQGLLDDHSAEVIALSDALRRLAIVKPSNPEVFRNPNGIAMKLGNFAALDPEYNGKGLRAGGKRDREVWNEFAHAPAKLAAAVKEILDQQNTHNMISELLEDESSRFAPEHISDTRTRLVTSIVYRRGQELFRRILLKAYEGRCAFSGYDAADALEAAHILAYMGKESNHVSNGLLLRADLHTLFDLGLIAVQPETMTIAVSETLRRTNYARFNGKQLRLPLKREQHPNEAALALHFLASKCSETR